MGNGCGWGYRSGDGMRGAVVLVSLVQPDVVFSTAHKSKGLEFDTVRICDDFLSFINNEDFDETIPLGKGVTCR